MESEARQSMHSEVMDRHGLRPRDDEEVAPRDGRTRIFQNNSGQSALILLSFTTLLQISI